ncbi:MAG: deoxyguanosinetriphosphate triphosphohydrolase [Lachnospiraceae bacterium]|nr:deoxyguanosinetriphosphate triphosphohydrolase [Lachnospiraceae bacterium]
MDWKNLLSKKTLAEREPEPKEWEKYPISPFENDYKAIISSAAFRRLQDKTQVFPLDKSDFVRTRLTHSIEVSTIAKQLGVMITDNTTSYRNDDFDSNTIKADLPTVLACAGLLHDLGNPPFGHFGEIVIGDWFKEKLTKNEINNTFAYKGQPIYDIINNNKSDTKQMYNDLCHFEGNAQSLRILSKINNKPDGYDVNLSYAVINALIKYPCNSLDFVKDSPDIKVHKPGYYLAEKDVFDEICNATGTKSGNKYYRHPLAYLMEAADDIAYATSDLEDALKKGLFNVDQFIDYFNDEIRKIDDYTKKKKSKELIENLENRINHLEVRNRENEIIEFQKWSIFAKGWLMYVVVFSFSKNYKAIMKGDYESDLFKDGFHSYSLEILKGAMSKFVFNSGEILRLELSANKIISSLLDDFVPAVIHWEINDKDYKPSKTDKKLIELISDNYRQDYLHAKTDNEHYNLYLRFLMVTDFISGMTDSYAKSLYQKLNGIE